jgi:ADP-heptose:LPS heptosyltransferase
MDVSSIGFKPVQSKNKAKTGASVYSLQGIGNTINSLRALIPLSHLFDLHIHTMAGSGQFLKEIGFNCNVHTYKNRIEILSQQKPKVDLALTLAPTWRREAFGLITDRSKVKRFCGGGGRIIKGVFKRAGREWDSHDVHDVDRNYDLLEELGVPFDSNANFFKELFYKTAEHSDTLVIHPTASSNHKVYPLRFWAEILRLESSKYEKTILLASANPEEVSFCESLKRELKDIRLEFLIGKNFREVSEVVASARQFIGLDSSLAHLAALFSVRSLVLWSNANYRRIHPYSPHSQVLIAKENIDSKAFEYTRCSLPQYSRLTAQLAINILQGETPRTFTVKTRTGFGVDFFEY